MSPPTPAFIVSAVGIFIVASYLDVLHWRRKPREELDKTLRSDGWRGHHGAIKELRKPGEDVSIYVPLIVAKLVSESKRERGAAHIIIIDYFPDLAAKIKGYSAFVRVEECRKNAAPLLAQFGVSHVA